MTRHIGSDEDLLTPLAVRECIRRETLGMSWVITDLTGSAQGVQKPTMAEAVRTLEDMLDQYMHNGYVVRTNNDVHAVSTAKGEVIHVFRVEPGDEE